MLKKNGTSWEALEPRWTNGIFIGPDASVDTAMSFKDSREYIEELLEPEEK
jgi:hypothetical protein